VDKQAASGAMAAVPPIKDPKYYVTANPDGVEKKPATTPTPVPLSASTSASTLTKAGQVGQLPHLRHDTGTVNS